MKLLTLLLLCAPLMQSEQLVAQAPKAPEAGEVLIAGNVKTPGTFVVKDGGETTVLTMLAMAEGLTPFSAKQAFIYRRDASGSKNEIPIDLGRIMDRKSPDVTLLPTDVLYIPDNRGRRLDMATLERILMFGATAGPTALMYGR
jgi:polysaccharide export outer membrane protein